MTWGNVDESGQRPKKQTLTGSRLTRGLGRKEVLKTWIEGVRKGVRFALRIGANLMHPRPRGSSGGED